MFVVIFTSLLGSGDMTLDGVTINLSTYYVVAEAAFGVISATYTNIAISTTFNRDLGILKRTRGTPLPAWAYMSGKVIHAMIIAFILVAITVAFGVVFYSAERADRACRSCSSWSRLVGRRAQLLRARARASRPSSRTPRPHRRS